METLTPSREKREQTDQRPSGRRPIPTAAWSLLVFVETVFLPLEALESSHNYRWQCRRAVRAFNLFLGYPAKLADLTADQVTRFAEWLPSSEPGSQVRLLRKRLRCIWRYAAVVGLAEPCEVLRRPKAERSAKPRPGRIKPVMTPGTVSHFFETVYLPKRLVGADAISIDGHRSKIRQLDRFAGNPVMVAELSDTLLAAFLNDRVAAGLRKVTVNQCRAHLLAVWRLAAELGHVGQWPSIKKLRTTHDEPDAWTEEEFRAILAKCDCLTDQPPLGGLPPGDVMRAVLLLAYWTGLRRGTLRKLQWSNIDVRERWLSVPGELMKNGRGKKLRFGVDAAEALAKINSPTSLTILPKINWPRFYACFDLVLDAASVPPSKRAGMTKLHKVRRTTATLLAMREGLGAASTLLGHSSEQMTRRYVDPSKLPGSDMTDVLPNLSTRIEGGAS